jgi:acyl-[acyl-carrier-protein]-phospholipid O-acyltransferase/long-chain-fatty-acid--[acyl-carrier-protein] ligase
MRNRWTGLFLANLWGVFNDNLLKNAIIFIAVGWSLPAWMTQSQLITIASASLVLPYLVLSPLAGMITVKYSGLPVFRFFKLVEFPIMVLAGLSFVLQSVNLAIIAMFLMGIQSALYSPAKYSLIRLIGGKEGSAFGSGMFETMAFAGILIGTLAAGILADNYQPFFMAAVFLLLAMAGYVSTLFIRVTRSEKDASLHEQLTTNPFPFLRDSFMLARSFPGVNRAVVGVSVFWGIGALLQMSIILHARVTLAASSTAAGVVMAMAAVGIALGAWLAGVLAKNISDRLLITVGLAGMILALLVILLADLTVIGFAVAIFITAFSGAFFQVPNLAVIQKAETGQLSGQILAYMNLVIFIFVLLGTALFSLTTAITNENSSAVFAVLLMICIFALVLYQPKPKKNKAL